jgi:hypothetical protein
MERYSIDRKGDGWAIIHNDASEGEPYATKEAAFEAVYGAASNAIKLGRAIIIEIAGREAGESSLGGSV